MRKNKKIIIAAALLVAAVGVGSYIYKSEGSDALSVETFSVKKQDVTETVLATGKVELKDKEELFALTSAPIKEIFVKEGQKVKKGEVIVTLDDSDLQWNLKNETASLAIAQANLQKSKAPARQQEIEEQKNILTKSQLLLENAQEHFDKYTTLYKDGVIPKEELDKSKLELVQAGADFNIAKQRLDLVRSGESKENIQISEAQVIQAQNLVNKAKEELKHCEIRAPFDGVVLQLNAKKGNFISFETTLATIANLENLVIKAKVNESDSGKLSEGQAASITAYAFPDEEFKGQVSKIGSIAEINTKGEQTELPVEISVQNLLSKLKPGYSVDLSIIVSESKNTLVVPYEAIRESDGKKEVFLVNQGKVHKKTITTGRGNALYLTVKSGLSEKDKVILNPSDELKENLPVKEVPSSETGDKGKEVDQI